MSAKFNFKRLGEPFRAKWPVTVNVPQDGGTVIEETFDAEFLLLSPEAQKEAEAKGGDAWIEAFLVGVEGETLTPELKAQLLGTSYVRAAIVKAYVGFAQGIAAKN